MPITLRCSSCAQALKVPDNMAGRRGKCPKCGAVLVIPAAEEEEPEETARPTTRKARPTQRAIIEEKAVPSRRRAAEATRDDDDETAEEAVPRPREVRKKKKKKQKKSSLLFYGLLGGCFTLLLLGSGGGVLTWWYFFSRSADDLAYMPSACQMIVSIHMDQLLDSQALQELRREIPDVDKGIKVDFDKEMGLDPGDVEHIIIGSGPVPNTVICVIHTKKPVQVADLRAHDTYTEKKVGKYVMHEHQHPMHPAFCVVDKKRVLVGNKGALEEALQRDKKAEFSKNLQEALKQVDFSKTIAFAADTPQNRPGPMGPGFPFMGGKNNLANVGKKINGFAIQATVGSDVRYDLTLLCLDAAAANEVKTAIEGFLGDIQKLINGFMALQGGNQAMQKEISDLLQLNLKVESTKVKGGNTVNVSALIKLYKQQKGKM
jgi:phage FluMu protein Com